MSYIKQEQYVRCKVLLQETPGDDKADVRQSPGWTSGDPGPSSLL